MIVGVVLLISCSPAQEPPPLASGIHAADIRKHQEFLGSTDLEGRGPGSEGSRKASDYIAARVKEWGYLPAGTDGGWFQPFGEGKRNIAALHRGSSDEYVVLGAHYDHLGKKGNAVFPGADDNASGTSTLLEVADRVGKAKGTRGVLFLWFDAEENHLEGSRWWASHPTLPIDKCFAMVNVDMIGRNETAKVFCGVQKTKAKEPVYPKLASALKEV
ncbi:MAG TPA: M28 family peptidase, partial [Planctomycetota bacterium]|nr:M28 family peptidase [Planctomycetota bacterium]